MNAANNSKQQQKPNFSGVAIAAAGDNNHKDEYADNVKCDATNRRACSPLNRRSASKSSEQQQQKPSASSRHQASDCGSITTSSSNYSIGNTDEHSDTRARLNRPRRVSSGEKAKQSKSALVVTIGTLSDSNYENDLLRDKGLRTSTAPNSADSDKKLVFGLNSRTNRVRHNEYAATRSSNSGLQSNSSSGTNTDDDNIPTSSKKVDFGIGHKRVIKPEPGSDDNKSKMVSSASTTTQPKRHSSPNRKKAATTTTTTTTTATTSRPEAKPKLTTTTSNDRKSNDEQTMTQENKQQKQPEPELEAVAQKPRKMQFNIPPPPPSKITSNKSSLVSYAKARIYDKQPPVSTSILPQQQGSMGSEGALSPTSLTSPSSLNNLSKSIIAGFKPPKQTIDVRKAREKWEGGEPFAKCKSRQRLAATQAGKKLQLHNSWSMTSLVATQQLQFQQALAANASKGQKSFGSSAHGPLDDNMPVKILSRGSVLERVQKFESAPSVSELAEATFGVVEPSIQEDLGSNGTSGSGDKKNQLRLNASVNPDTCFVESPVAGLTTDQYFSTLQNARRKTLEELKANANGSTDNVTHAAFSSASKSQIMRENNSRRLSLRRRSSLNSLASKIPKFYHPNGKPNTYEIELQRRNIVACFDKFPDRKAAFVGPNCRKNFHQIALACGFSEYFKEPLMLFVRHLEPTWSQERASHPMARKQSSFERSPSGRKLSISINPNSAAASPLASPTTPALANIRPSLNRSFSIDVTRSAENQQPANGSVTPCDDPNQLSLKFITCDQYFVCWRHLIEHSYDNAARFIHLLTYGQRNYLVPDDFIPLVQSIIDDHPGLRFLGSAPDFHMRYIQTVIARIYFDCNKSWTGKLTQTELRHSNLLDVLMRLSQTDDINEITDYFSYEHFYVIYCKFWSLDQDHDLEISKEDLIRHNDNSISSRIIERIFMGIVSRQIQETGKMGYSDFVWFLIAEENKKHPRAIEYWFRLMDIDGDGYISMYEMEYFYVEQMKRLELMSIEALPFLDCACQMLDLVNPKEKNRISLSDLKRTKMVTIFYDTFINLEKYLEHESREFVSTRDVIINGKIVSDWDRYASQEYENLSSEETSI